jgi:hypothetical protein
MDVPGRTFCIPQPERSECENKAKTKGTGHQGKIFDLFSKTKGTGHQGKIFDLFSGNEELSFLHGCTGTHFLHPSARKV